jgi:hypothetical protein
MLARLPPEAPVAGQGVLQGRHPHRGPSHAGHRRRNTAGRDLVPAAGQHRAERAGTITSAPRGRRWVTPAPGTGVAAAGWRPTGSSATRMTSWSSWTALRHTRSLGFSARLGLACSAFVPAQPALTRSAPFSAIIMVGAIVFPLTSRGMIDASMMRSRSSPWTRRSESTTASSPDPIRQVPTAW